MVGGEIGAYEQAQSLLQNLGKRVVHCGPTGNGLIVKMCNNMLLGISMIATSEALNLGRVLGVDPKILTSVINSSSGCWSSDTYNPVPGVMENVPAARGYEGGFANPLMAKDLALSIGAAHGKAPVVLGSVAYQMYNRLISLNAYAGKDFSSIYSWLSAVENAVPSEGPKN